MTGSHRRHRRHQGPDERGFTLVEVLVATVIMLVVLVPSSLLLSSSTSVLSYSQSKWVASNLLAGIMEQDRAVAEESGISTSGGWPASGGNPIAPSLPAISSRTVNGVTFSFTRTLGWCAEQTVNGVTNWGDYPNADTVVFTTVPATVYQPPAFSEYVVVEWPGHSLGSGQVLPTPAANQELTNGNPPTSSTKAPCPLK